MRSPGKGRDGPCLFRILSLNIQRGRKNPPGRQLGSLELAGTAAAVTEGHTKGKGGTLALS